MNLEFRNLNCDEIEVRVGNIAKDKEGNIKGLSLLLYKTSRTDMQLLDETVGAFNWCNDYREIKGNMYAGIAIRDNGDWVWKWDCGTESNQEAEKGEASDSFKRAGFRWGIGRALYTSPFLYFPANLIKDKFDRFKVTDIVYNKNRISSVTICNTTTGNTKTFSQDTEIKPAKEITKALSEKKQDELVEAFTEAGFKDINSLLARYNHGSLAEFTEAEYKDALAKFKAVKNGN